MPNSQDFASIQLIQGVNESRKPSIKIKRSEDGRTGKAFFIFKINAVSSREELSQIKQMTMLDREGALKTNQINILFNNSNEYSIEAIYSWKSDLEFKRFMRFAKSYSDFNSSSKTVNKEVD
tara:strand:- start:1337 stop:1702 length:366 start_codon:yes stop_codon:yes gene_type:complete